MFFFQTGKTQGILPINIKNKILHKELASNTGNKIEILSKLEDVPGLLLAVVTIEGNFELGQPNKDYRMKQASQDL